MAATRPVVDDLRHLPRWYRARAERLTAALCELVLEACGHETLRARLGSGPWGRALGAAVGLGQTPELPQLAALCASALRPEGERLDILLEPAGLRLPDGPVTPWFAVDGVQVVPLRAVPAAARPSLAQRLGAARMLPHHRDSAGLHIPERPPGHGPRELLALGLLADVVFEPTPDPALAALALGELDGTGLPLTVYDGVLVTLEGWLHGAAAGAWRAAPLALLREERLRLESDASPYEPSRLIEQDLRHATDLVLKGREDDAPPPPRRPQRRLRRLRGFTPPTGPARLSHNLELFAP